MNFQLETILSILRHNAVVQVTALDTSPHRIIAWYAVALAFTSNSLNETTNTILQHCNLESVDDLVFQTKLIIK